jgi:putative PEP-CTERM system histidine kinase
MWHSARIFDSIRLGTLLGFVAVLLRGNDAAARALTRREQSGLLALAALLSVGLVAVGTPMPGDGAAGSRAGVVFTLHLAISVCGLVLVEQLYRRTPVPLRWNVRPLCLGVGGLFAFDLIVYSDALLFRTLDVRFWDARGLAHALVVPLLAIGAGRNRDWKLDVAVSHRFMVGSTALFASGLYLLVVGAIGYQVQLLGGAWGKALQVLMLFAAALFLGIVTWSGTVRSKLRVFIAKNFFAYRYDYREEWLKFTRALSSANEQSQLFEHCIRALAEFVESGSGVLWLKNPDESFRQVARVSEPAIDDMEPAGGALTAFLARSGWVVDIPDARTNPAKYPGLSLPAWLDRMPNAWLIVPLLNGVDLVGFVVIARPRVKVEINWEVLDLLKTAGRQAASYLATVQATEALLEARKFDAFNRMSAFVVHDLKNLVAQLQLMLRNAERHHHNPEFQRDMLGTIQHVVERMNQLMRQLRVGEAPVENPRPVDLSALVARLQDRRDGSKVTVDAPHGVLALGHEDRLERVIGHLVQNGIDAARGDPQVAVRVYRDGARAVLEVTDNGVGMSAEFVRDRLFKPFETTKKLGMGIGAYESFQYINGLGGNIHVDSKPNEGTKIRVLLPAANTGDVAERAA